MSHHPHDPLQPELFSEELLRPSLEHELAMLERTAVTFDEGWRISELDERLTRQL